jgi:hypothetical protein
LVVTGLCPHETDGLVTEVVDDPADHLYVYGTLLGRGVNYVRQEHNHAQGN